MIEDTLRRNQRDRQLARRRGVAPSQHLKRHFVALARQVCQWATTRSRSESGRGLTIGVTSLTKGAGKSTISFNLASSLVAIARSQVLLLESDFGNPYISRRLGMAKSPGLSEVLTGGAEFIDALQPTPMTDLSVLGCGLFSESEALELPFDLLAHLFEERLCDFGFIVVDLPIANHLTTCHSILPHLDGVVLTVESNQVDQREIIRFRQQAQQQNSNIIGVVINKA